MPSTYSSNLKIELIATGEQDGTWGSTTNTNLGTALEQAITGSGSVVFASADVTLGFASSNAAQDFRNIRLVLSGTTAGPRNLVVPNIQKLYLIDNTTVDTVTVKTAAGVGIAIPSGTKGIVYADGVNVVQAITHINSPSFTGTPTAPTAAPGTNSTQLATTAFTAAAVTAATSSLGTMATQNANNVAITGGSITGITDLAVADGGTGASTAANARTNLGLGTIATQDANNVAITGGSITGSYALTAANVSGTIAVANGGTGATTATNARTNLGLGTIATQDANSVAITGGSIINITDLAIADGGTGASSAAGARINLGLGTIATQNVNSVLITGGSITGITDLTIADGGTGASTASDARTNLGLGTIATLNTINNSNWGGTALSVVNGGTGASNTANARANLGLGTIATQNSNAVSIGGGSITGSYALTAANVSGTVAVANGGTGATTATDARTNLGLGTIATQNANNVGITGGSIAGIADLAVADGGTGASSFTANNVLLGNGTSAFQTVAPGTSGNVLTSNGTTWVSAPGGVNGQVFTSNGTFTIPAGVTRLKVTVVGGGGGGCDGGGFGQNGTRGGGGGGGTAIKYLTGLTPGNTLTVTVGSGGSRGQPGTAGGNSTVASGTQSITTIRGDGGAGGVITFGEITAGGIGVNGDLNIRGGGSYSGSEGIGGSSTMGGGSGVGGTSGANAPGGAYGGGGSSMFNNVGSAGAAGVVFFEW